MRIRLKERINFETDRFLNLQRGALARWAMIEAARKAASELRDSQEISRRDLDVKFPLINLLPARIRGWLVSGTLTMVGLTLLAAVCGDDKGGDNVQTPTMGSTGPVPEQAIDPDKLSQPFVPAVEMELQQAWEYSGGISGFHGASDYIHGEIDNSKTWQTFPVLAAADGRACANPEHREGNAVLILHTPPKGSFSETYYGHLATIEPKILANQCTEGEHVLVSRGEILGMAGATGVRGKNDKGVEVDQPTWIHLHFQVKQDGSLVDPYDLRSVREVYPNPNFTNDKNCGPKHLWVMCPQVLGTTVGTPKPTATHIETATPVQELYFGIFQDGKMGLMDSAGRVIISPQFDQVSTYFNEEVTEFRIGEKWGYADKAGTVVIEPVYDKVHAFFEGLAPVEIGGKVGFINHSGEIVIPLQFESALQFHEGLAAVKIGGQWGFIDKSGQMVIKPQFVATQSFLEGQSWVLVNTQWALIDKSGKFLIPPRFTDIHGGAFTSNRQVVPVEVNYGKWGLIDKTGEFITPTQFDEIGTFNEGLAPVRIGDKWGYIDTSGEIVISPQFLEAETFFGESKLAPVKKTVWLYRDPNTRAFVKTENFQEAQEKSGGIVFEQQRWGFIDKSGTMVIGADLLEVEQFKEGLAAVAVTDPNDYTQHIWGYIDTGGSWVIPAQFKYAGSFWSGIAEVYVDDECIFVDQQGNKFTDFACS